MRALSLLILLVGCEGRLYPQGAGDASGGRDVGARDTGAGRDAGGVSDAGTLPDVGRVDTGGVDARPPADAGRDAGTVDAGQDTGAPDVGRPDAGMPERCAGGPLDAPIAGCNPTAPPSTGDLAEDCVRRINQFRLECQCLPPLARWVEGESCATAHATYDSEGRPAHSGFRDRICTPGGRAQNECPGYPSESSIVSLCLKQMWDEGPGEPFSEHGHYINMTNPAHSRVACGVFVREDGLVWAVQNFE